MWTWDLSDSVRPDLQAEPDKNSFRVGMWNVSKKGIKLLVLYTPLLLLFLRGSKSIKMNRNLYLCSSSVHFLLP